MPGIKGRRGRLTHRISCFKLTSQRQCEYMCRLSLHSKSCFLWCSHHLSAVSSFLNFCYMGMWIFPGVFFLRLDVVVQRTGRGINSKNDQMWSAKGSYWRWYSTFLFVWLQLFCLCHLKQSSNMLSFRPGVDFDQSFSVLDSHGKQNEVKFVKIPFISCGFEGSVICNLL